MLSIVLHTIKVASLTWALGHPQASCGTGRCSTGAHHFVLLGYTINLNEKQCLALPRLPPTVEHEEPCGLSGLCQRWRASMLMG